MTNDIEIVKATHQHLSQVEAWAVRNAAVHTLLKTPRSPARDAGDGYYWAALHGGEVVAIAMVELNKEHVGYITCVVKPGHQRQGIGSQLFEYVLGQPVVKDLVHLHAAVDSSNVAARKTLNQYGFSRIGYDADGRIEFARHNAPK